MFEPVCTLGSVEIPLLFDLLVNGNADVLYQSGAGNHPTETYVRVWTSWTDGKTYLLVHNRSMQTLSSLSIPASAGTWEPIGLTSPGAVTSTAPSFTMSNLGPEEIRLYEKGN
jgi:hypothetical protein